MQFIDLKTQYQALRDPINARASSAVLDHGQYIHGPRGRRSWRPRLPPTPARKHCITAASGTEALLISLMALDVKPGDEIITTSFTFVATAEVRWPCWARMPVFVDVEPDTCNIKVSEVEAKHHRTRTKAIIPVSLYGQCGDMDELNAVAARHGLPRLIQDAAQSFGATYKGRKSCNSVHPGLHQLLPQQAAAAATATAAPLLHQRRRAGRGAAGRSACTASPAATTTRASAWRPHGHAAVRRRARASCAGFDWEGAERVRIGARYSELLTGSPAGAPAPWPCAPTATAQAQYTVMVPDREAVQARR